MAVTDIRVLVPRVRRAIEGAGAPALLSDDNIKDVIADACSDVMLYVGGLFGKDLTVIERDTNGSPIEYATSDELTFPEQSVVSAQAALTYFFFMFAGLKVSESIVDEASTWDYSLSANLLRDQLKLLQDSRDRALEAIESASGNMDAYISFLAHRDVQTSRLVEPWVWGLDDSGFGGGGGGLEIDPRFGVEST